MLFNTKLMLSTTTYYTFAYLFSCIIQTSILMNVDCLSQKTSDYLMKKGWIFVWEALKIWCLLTSGSWEKKPIFSIFQTNILPRNLVNKYDLINSLAVLYYVHRFFQAPIFIQCLILLHLEFHKILIFTKSWKILWELSMKMDFYLHFDEIFKK